MRNLGISIHSMTKPLKASYFSTIVTIINFIMYFEACQIG